jgi:hypothetical protein
MPFKSSHQLLDIHTPALTVRLPSALSSGPKGSSRMELTAEVLPMEGEGRACPVLGTGVGVVFIIIMRQKN